MPYKCTVYGETFRDDEALYHYTTLENLKKIIESRTLLFNRCDKMNDLIEGNRTYVKYYVSSFTYCKDESIPMWYIYTRGKSGCTNCNIGVRISVENNDFFTGKVYFDPEKKDSYRNISESDGIFCGKTIYDDNKDTSPTQGNMNSYTSSGLSVGLTSVPKLGLEGKTTAWSYEKEARFFTLDTGIHADKIFIGLENSFFDSLKITISPLQTDEQVENAEKEIEKLLGKDRCEPSKLKGTLRFD